MADNSTLKDSEFVGYDYDNFKYNSTILRVVDKFVVLDKTPFYAEAGGQVGDTGELIYNELRIPVIDTFREDNLIIHKIDSFVGDAFSREVIAKIDSIRRWDVMRNHSVTHFLHASLRKILGTHVQQAGSYVGPDHLRFDFTHFTKPSPEELEILKFW